MSETETSTKNSNTLDSFDKTAIINLWTGYVKNKDFPTNNEKVDTTLKTVKFKNQNVQELNTSEESEDFEKLVNLEDVKNIEELESSKESQNFEESIDFEEIKNIEKTEELKLSKNFEESVNFKDIRNIERSIIIELDDVELSRIQNNTQACPYLLIEIPSQKLEDENQNTNFQKSTSKTTNDIENNQTASNPIVQQSNSNNDDNYRKESIKRKRTEEDTVITNNVTSKVANQEAKLIINRNESQTIYVRPITPSKFHETKKICIENHSGEQDVSLSSPVLSDVQRNVTDKKQLNFNTSQDKCDNSDNELDQIYNFIKNENYDSTQFSVSTIKLLDEFNETDQSTNEKLLADLIDSPIRNKDETHEESNTVSTPEIVQDVKDAFEITFENEVTNEEDLALLKIVEDQIENENSVEIGNDHLFADKQSDTEHENFVEIANDHVVTDNQSDNDHEKVSSSYEDDDNDSSYRDDDYTSDEIRESSSEVDMEELKEKVRKVKKSLVIKREVREKLAKFSVKITHEVPPQHMLETTVITPPNRRLQLLFEKYVPLKKGPSTPSEDKIIKKNWEHFCKVHKWDPADIKPFLQFRYKKSPMIKHEEAIKFARFMARGLPSRSLNGVISRFRRLFRESIRKQSRFDRCNYTAKEDKIIKAFLKNEPNDQIGFKKLAKLLDRSYDSVFYRWQLLKRKEGREAFLSQKNIKKHVNWDLSLAEKFLKNLMKLTLSDDIEELKDSMIPLVVWNKLERKMKISISCLKSFWFDRLHTQLFYERPFFMNDIKVLLIEYMYGKGITNREEINWSDAAEYFDGIPKKYIMKVFYTMGRNCGVRMKSNLGGIINYLYHHRINQIKLKRNDKYLPGVIYKDGKLEVIHRSYPTIQNCDINNLSEDIC